MAIPAFPASGLGARAAVVIMAQAATISEVLDTVRAAIQLSKSALR